MNEWKNNWTNKWMTLQYFLKFLLEYSWFTMLCWFYIITWHFPCGSTGKESACNVGDLGSIPGLGRSPREGKGYPLQYSGPENSMDSIAHGVTKSRTQLRKFHIHTHTHTHTQKNSLVKEKLNRKFLFLFVWIKDKISKKRGEKNPPSGEESIRWVLFYQLFLIQSPRSYLTHDVSNSCLYFLNKDWLRSL